MPKRILQGTVTSDKNDQTVTVLPKAPSARSLLRPRRLRWPSTTS